MRNRYTQVRFLPGTQAGPFQRIVYTILSVAFLAGMLFFGVFIFLGVLSIALIGGVFFWFKTRKLRQQIKEQMEQGQPFASVKPQSPEDGIIDGEWEEVDSEEKNPWN
ncbi:MAG: hypothetical protein ACWA5R_13335 [bacterium]